MLSIVKTIQYQNQNGMHVDLEKGAPDSGEILISFSIVPDDYSFKTPLKYMDLVKTVDFDEYE